MYPTQYPDAHLLGLPLEILDLIFDELASLSSNRLWLKNTWLRITAVSPPSLSLLLAHSKLYAEALRHFYEHTTIVLHVNAFDAAQRSPEHAHYSSLLLQCPHIMRMRKLELRPLLNAGVEFLEPEIQEACVVILEMAKELEYIYVGWSEVPKHFLGGWRPWAYKRRALMPLRLLRGRFTMQVVEVTTPPPRFAGMENVGLLRAFQRMVGKLHPDENLLDLDGDPLEDTFKIMKLPALTEKTLDWWLRHDILPEDEMMDICRGDVLKSMRN
ncbi:hypothetical protein E2P81_ATG05207 [Venturia nashicola]|nr:hypothetical protein E2P81_ATG05207 [Venturia nashicola]